MLQSAVRSDQRIAIYWPKNDLLLLFIIIVKGGVVPTKMDWNAMNLTRWHRERKKERKESDRRRKRRKNKWSNPKFCQWCRSFIRRFEMEIDLSWLPCRHPYNHFTLGRLNQKWQNHTKSVCAEPLFVIPACEPKIQAKNSISRLWLVEIGDHVGSVDGSMTLWILTSSETYWSFPVVNLHICMQQQQSSPPPPKKKKNLTNMCDITCINYI